MRIFRGLEKVEDEGGIPGRRKEEVSVNSEKRPQNFFYEGAGDVVWA